LIEIQQLLSRLTICAAGW